MKTSRQRLLEFVQAQHLVSAQDVAQALRMTPANARHHLNILVEQGLVSIVGQRHPAGKGRPLLLYGVAAERLGHNLDQLNSALLSEVTQTMPVDVVAALLAGVAGRMAGVGEESRPATLTRRLYAAVQRLNSLHYAARWEAHADAPRLILGHCPYAAIIEQHPELCQVDAHLLERLSGVAVTQIARRVEDHQGLRVCVFRLQG